MTSNELTTFSDYDSHFNSRAVESPSLGTFHSLQPTLSRPSHDYDLYRQQTGIPLGAFESTLAVNQQQQASLGYRLEIEDEILDFKPAPACDESHISTDFDSSNPEPVYFYSTESTMTSDSPNIEIDHPLSIFPTQVDNIGRLWPGMHQQQAETKALQRPKQAKQQQINENDINNPSQKSLVTKIRAPKTFKDPIVEEKISQILKSMRQTNTRDEFIEDTTMNQVFPSRGLLKREEEMDDDERLLASEEGKKLSSKERRQLRNKVSARAFRSRRKEYINQLEDEIALKTNENGDLRAQNQALIEENTRLLDLTRMLISSPSFSGFIDALAMSPAIGTNAQSVQQQIEKNIQPQPQPNKDINPNVVQQQIHQQYLSTAILAEPPQDFSTLDFNIEDNPPYQPQVFFVRNIPETLIDSDIISCKTCPLLASETPDNKILFPQIERRSSLEGIQFEASVFGFKSLSNDHCCTSFDFNSSSLPPENSACRLTLPIQLSPDQPDDTNIFTANSESDAALKRANRLVAETDACFKRLSALTQRL